MEDGLMSKILERVHPAMQLMPLFAPTHSPRVRARGNSRPGAGSGVDRYLICHLGIPSGVGDRGRF